LSQKDSQDELIDVQYTARSGVNSRQDYDALYKESIRDPAGFWAKLAEEFHWHKKVGLGQSCIVPCLSQLSGGEAVQVANRCGREPRLSQVPAIPSNDDISASR